jgi:hypothetical protein
MPSADEFDTASAIEDMANTLDQGSIDWGRGPEGNEGIINRGTTSSGVQSVEWDGNLIGTPIQQESSPILDEAAYERIMGHMRPDQEAEQPANITDQITRNKSSLETSNGVMDWGKGPEGSEGTIDLGENPSLQALQDALGGGPLAGKADFMQKEEESPLDPAKAGADVNAFLAATRGSDIRRQEELGITPNRQVQGGLAPRTGIQTSAGGIPIRERNIQHEIYEDDWGNRPLPSGLHPSIESGYGVAPEDVSSALGGKAAHVDPTFKSSPSGGAQGTQYGSPVHSSVLGGPGSATTRAVAGDDTRGDNPVDIIRSTYAWASSLPNNVLFNAARYPDYLRLLIEYDAAGKNLPLTVPSWILEGTARPEGAP